MSDNPPGIVPVTRYSHFKRFSSGLHHQAKSYRDATHLLLSGGLRRFEKEEEDDVLKMLAKDIDDNTPNYVVEMRTPVFRFCMDFDFVTPDGITLRKFIEYMKVVQGVIQACVPAASSRDVVVLYAPEKSVACDVTIDTKRFFKYTCKSGTSEHMKKDMTKSGFHAIWPYVFVDMEAAITVRFVILQKMQEMFPDYGSADIHYERLDKNEYETATMQYGSWDNVLDLAIYTANGLRMPGSHKASKCPVCKGAKGDAGSEECHACKGMRYVDDGRPYGVAAYIHEDGSYDREKTHHLVNHAYEALQLTSIRCRRDEKVVTVETPQWFSSTTDLENCLDRVLKRSSVGSKRQRDTSKFISNDDWGKPGERVERKINGRFLEFETVSPQDPRAVAFEGCINSLLPHGHRDVRLKQTLISASTTKMYILAKSATQWCMNVEREHTGNQVYYIFDGRCVQQRCWSIKSGPDRKHGPCSSADATKFFRDNKAIVPKSSVAQLFPHQHKSSNAMVQMISRPSQSAAAESRGDPSSRGVIPGNRHPKCTSEAIRAQMLADIFRRDIAAASPDLPKQSFGSPPR